MENSSQREFQAVFESLPDITSMVQIHLVVHCFDSINFASFSSDQNDNVKLVAQAEEMKDNISNMEVICPMPISFAVPDQVDEDLSKAIVIYSAPAPAPEQEPEPEPKPKPEPEPEPELAPELAKFEATDIFTTRELQDAGAERFSELLEGWIIEKKKRIQNGRIDKYYLHKLSQKKLRSRVEAKKFIRRKAFPGSHEDSNEAKSAEPSSTKRKGNNSPSFIENSDEKDEECYSPAEVKKFLDDSYNNLLNLRKKAKPSEDGSMKISEQEVKKFLEDSYNNLLNRPQK